MPNSDHGNTVFGKRVENPDSRLTFTARTRSERNPAKQNSPQPELSEDLVVRDNRPPFTPAASISLQSGIRTGITLLPCRR